MKKVANVYLTVTSFICQQKRVDKGKLSFYNSFNSSELSSVRHRKGRMITGTGSFQFSNRFTYKICDGKGDVYYYFISRTDSGGNY